MLTVVVRNGTVRAAEGAATGADLVIETGSAIKALLTGEFTPSAAVANDQVRLTDATDPSFGSTTMFRL